MSSSSGVPLDKICAVLCNYKRPLSAERCVQKLKELGVGEVIVWNNGAKPIPDATVNINRPKNIGPLGKYLAGLYTKMPYVLVTDDDYLITKPGIDALRKWVRVYPAVTQVGDVYWFFNQETGNRLKTRYFSDQIKEAKRVDLVLPYHGMMLKASLYRRIPQHWAWKALGSVRPGYFFTDQAMTCAIWDLTGEYPVIIPSKEIGYQKLPEESPGVALSKQEGRYQEFVKIWRWLLAHGWRFRRFGNPVKPINARR